VALISFGDVPLAAALQPALTVVDQNPDALGRFAATRLFERLDNPSRRLRRNTVLPVTLVARASSLDAAGPSHASTREGLISARAVPRR
jgi:LacI family transcriptional regulator, galactose operon repressor